MHVTSSAKHKRAAEYLDVIILVFAKPFKFNASWCHQAIWFKCSYKDEYKALQSNEALMIVAVTTHEWVDSGLLSCDTVWAYRC